MVYLYLWFIHIQRSLCGGGLTISRPETPLFPKFTPVTSYYLPCQRKDFTGEEATWPRLVRPFRRPSRFIRHLALITPTAL